MAKNRIHSVLTALPLLMLMIGLFYYYQREQAQLDGPLVLSETIEIEGVYKGLSEVRSGGQGQHFLWLISSDRTRGGRVSAEEAWSLKSLQEPLSPGDLLSVQMAPTVSGSKTLWVSSVKRNGEVVFYRAQ